MSKGLAEEACMAQDLSPYVSAKMADERKGGGLPFS
jgi:hypothetical protein